ncbi:hypothetical protein DFH29DRAFT_1079830 [Suillus ampliporus]|nr:hypothetical protein DFH29DRAFT_1079830 [Suillus ampliporus]
MSLMLLRAIQSWRTANNHLYDVLLKHNIFYYACGLFFSVANVFMSLLLQYAYNAMFQDFQVIILTILATRMHLHLWHVDRQIHGSDALIHIPLSDVSSAGRWNAVTSTATLQTSSNVEERMIVDMVRDEI